MSAMGINRQLRFSLQAQAASHARGFVTGFDPTQTPRSEWGFFFRPLPPTPNAAT